MLRTETLTQCPVCGGTALHRLLTVPDHESHTGSYGIDECTGCQVAFTNPRPIERELPKLYEHRSTADFPPLDHGFIARLRDFAVDRYLAAQLGGRPASGDGEFSALDFGCGDGALSRGLIRFARTRKFNLNVTAVDFHEVAPPALAHIGLAARYRTHADWQRAPERYDAIFLRHVLEHHPDPLRLLGELAATLNPGGRLFVEVPNRRSVWARALRQNYFAYYVPRHLFHFDFDSARTTFARAGFTHVRIRRGHTPLLGRSIGYAMGRDISNTGVFGLATYPLQLAGDVAALTSTTLRIIASTEF